MDLQEWAKIFLKHQDLIKREIKEIVEKPGELILKKKIDEKWLIKNELPETINSFGIVVPNTRDNFKKLLNNWKNYINESHKIIFVNVSKNDKWIINPWQHNKIADKTSLKLGLETMFKNVPVS